MTPHPTDAIEQSEAAAGRPRRSSPGVLIGLACIFGAGALAIEIGHRNAGSAMLDLGPTDSHYARDFREIERDGPAWFRWSSVPSSSLALPLRFCGPGSVRLRVRRHFVEPATISVSIGGAVLGQRSVRARDDHPYEVITFPVSKIPCGSYASVLLEASADNDRALGVAVDWVEVLAPQGFRAGGATILRGGALLAAIALALGLCGATVPAILSASAAMATLLGFAFAMGPMAAERVLRGGLPALILTLLLGALVARLTGARNLTARARLALLAITLVTLCSRAAFLDTQAFYPDYRVHGLVQQTFSRIGLPAFLDQLFEIQYARSLGLQQIDGNWYPFPYPPGAYAVAGMVASLFGLDSLDASIVTASVFASLIPLITLALGMALGLGESTGLAAAFYVALQPLLVRRMALGYFPGIAGQFADAAALLLFAGALRAKGSGRIRRTALLTLALLCGFLVYTQSIANFGLLISGLLALEAMRPSPGGRGAALRVALAGTLALVASVGLFYSRYQPVMENVSDGRPQPEAKTLDRLEDLRRRVPAALEVTEADDLNDPFAGSTLNPLRGLARLGSRLWRFNGPFVLVVAIGGWFLWRRSERATQNLMLAWFGVAVWISLLAAGLPSPNGFQHLKDLEFVSPLLALAMGALTMRLWEWRRGAAAALAISWVLFALRAFAVEWLERLLPLADR